MSYTTGQGIFSELYSIGIFLIIFCIFIIYIFLIEKEYNRIIISIIIIIISTVILLVFLKNKKIHKLIFLK
jgi:hypothetical protein